MHVHFWLSGQIYRNNWAKTPFKLELSIILCQPTYVRDKDRICCRTSSSGLKLLTETILLNSGGALLTVRA